MKAGAARAQTANRPVPLKAAIGIVICLTVV